MSTLDCCDLHRPAVRLGLVEVSSCCDPDDCGPCCENCPTCPTLRRATALNPAVELVEQRAVIDWTLGGVIVADDGRHIGHVDDLPDHVLERFLEGLDA